MYKIYPAPAAAAFSNVSTFQDIMDTYPSLDRVKAEQQLRKEKLELTSALLDLRATNLQVASLGQYEEELHKVNVLKNRFVESVHQFLNLFGHEVCDDDRILYKNEIIDIEWKVQEHSDEIRKQAKDMKALEHYKTILDKEGLRGLYRGYNITATCVPLFNMLYMPLYETLKINFA